MSKLRRLIEDNLSEAYYSGRFFGGWKDKIDLELAKELAENYPDGYFRVANLGGGRVGRITVNIYALRFKVGNRVIEDLAQVTSGHGGTKWMVDAANGLNDMFGRVA